MAYTVVGMFPTNEAADRATRELDSAGFGKENYSVSRYSTSGEYDPVLGYDYEEDEKTGGFWNWLFGDDDKSRNKYSYAGTKSNVVTVYADSEDNAEKARDIMNQSGALDVNDITKDRYGESTTADTSLSEKERARIISKAKNNLYLTGDTRNYSIRTRGMSNEMDSLGSEDAF